MIKDMFNQIALIAAGYVDHLDKKAVIEAKVRMASDVQGTLIAFGALALGFTVAWCIYTLVKRGMELDFERDYKSRRAEENTEEWRARAEKAWDENNKLKGKD